jgi:hypothetical protein
MLHLIAAEKLVKLWSCLNFLRLVLVAANSSRLPGF